MTKRSTATSTSETATCTVNLRLHEDIRNLIDRAAQSQGKSRSEFMIDAARRAAEDALLDQTLVRVDAETYAHFLNVLDQPAGGDDNDRQMKQSAEFSVSPNTATLGEPAAHPAQKAVRCAAELFRAIWEEGGIDIEAPPDLPVDDVNLD